MKRIRLDKRTREAIRAKRKDSRETVINNLSTPWVRPVREIVNVTRSGVIQYGRKDSTLMVRGMVEAKAVVIRPLPETMDDAIMYSRNKPEGGLTRMDKARDPVRLSAERYRSEDDKDQSRAIRRLPDKATKREEPMVRVGTVPARRLLIDDPETGGKKLLRITEKPRFVMVGLPTSRPR